MALLEALGFPGFGRGQTAKFAKQYIPNPSSSRRTKRIDLAKTDKIPVYIIKGKHVGATGNVRAFSVTVSDEPQFESVWVSFDTSRLVKMSFDQVILGDDAQSTSDELPQIAYDRFDVKIKPGCLVILKKKFDVGTVKQIRRQHSTYGTTFNLVIDCFDGRKTIVKLNRPTNYMMDRGETKLTTQEVMVINDDFYEAQMIRRLSK